MAIGLENHPNNDAINAAYPYGGIKDNTGVGNGTPINKLTNDDIHQTLRKILALAGITPNGLPDNVTNGYQYIQGLYTLFRNFRGVKNYPTNLTTTLTVNDMGYHVDVSGNTSTKNFNLPDSATLQDGDGISFYNNVAQICIVQSVTASVNGGADITLPDLGDYVYLVLDKPNNNWVPISYRATYPIPLLPTYIHNQISATLTGTNHTLIYQTAVSGDSVLYNTTDGRFTPTQAGLYEITWTAVCSSFAGYSAQMFIGSQVNKNGVQVGFITDRKDVRTDSDWITTGGSVLVEANGTTDYFEIILYNGSSLQKTVYGNFFAKRLSS